MRCDPTVIHMSTDGQSTELSIVSCAWPSRPDGWNRHWVPFHRRISGAINEPNPSSNVYCPTPVHEVAEAHDTAARLGSSIVRGRGGRTSFHEDPFHHSVITRSLPDLFEKLPTAMHVEGTQPTPDNSPSVVPGGMGTRSSRQVRPFQVSTKGRLPPDFAPKYGAGTSCPPTATQRASVMHDNDVRKLLPFSIGAIGDSAPHGPPSAWMAYGTRIVYRLPVDPTAMHRPGAEHSMLPRVVSVSGTGTVTWSVDTAAIAPAATRASTATIATIARRRSPRRRDDVDAEGSR